MKNYSKSVAAAFLMLGFIFTGCSDDKNSEQTPFDKTVAAFQKEFPNAQNVKWQKKKGHDVATFTTPSTTKAATNPVSSAWYLEGSTQCAYAEIEISATQLDKDAPKVAAAWNASPYKTQGFVLEDIDVLSHADKTSVYKLEVEKGEQEIELFYSKEGVLLCEQPDADNKDDEQENEPCPQAIYDFITANFPGAVIVDFDLEDEDPSNVFYEVEIFVGNVEKELIFSKDFKFAYSIVEIEEEALPEVIKKAFIALASDTESWSDIAKMENEKQKVIGYLLAVEDEKTEIEKIFKVDAEGKTIK
ncbi:MAG: PepSY-like domain-containing protein [Rikenellaceae bacterium]